MKPETFKEWAVVELFGHNRIAGLVSEQAIGGASFIRVDVPAVGDNPAYTKFYGGAAIYAITPTSQELATLAASRIGHVPVDPWIIRSALPAPQDDEPSFDDDDSPLL